MSQSIETWEGTKRLCLRSGQAFRQPVYGSAWTKIRIVLRYCVPTAGAITGTPRLVVGMSAGNVNGFGSAETDNFLGFRTESTTWTPSNNTFSFITGRSVKRVGTTITSHASALTTTLRPGSMHDSRSILAVQLEKGSPNWTIRILHSATDPLADATDDQFLAVIDNDESLSGSISGFTSSSANQALAFDEDAGALTHIHIFWDKISAPLEIEDVGHRLIAA